MLDRSMGRGLINRITSVGIGLKTLSIIISCYGNIDSNFKAARLGRGEGSESHQEAVMPTPLLTPKRITNIATWNIRTMFEAGKAAQVKWKMEHYKILLLGLCKTQ